MLKHYKALVFCCIYLVFLLPKIELHAQTTVDSLKLALKKATHDSTKCNILTVLIEADSDDSVWPLHNDELKKLCELNLKKYKPGQPEFTFFKTRYGDALNNIGYFYKNVEVDLTKALEFYQKSLKVYEEVGFKDGSANALNNIAVVYKNEGDLNLALEYYYKSLKITEETGNKEKSATSLNHIGRIYKSQGNIPQALEFFEKSMKINEEIKDKEGIANSYTDLGSIYENQGNIRRALEYYQKGLKIREEMGNKEGIAIALNNIAFIYQNQDDHPKALEYFHKSLKLMEELGNKQGISVSLNNIGLAYDYQGNFPKALEYYQKSLTLKEETGNKRGVATSLSNLGLFYKNHGDIAKGLEYLQKSLKIYEEIGDKKGTSGALINIGTIHKNQKNFVKAIAFYEKGFALANELGFPKQIGDAAGNLYESYKATGNMGKALGFYEVYIEMRDSISNLENKKAAIKSQFQYQYDKKAAADSVKTAEEKKVVALQFKQERTQRIALYGGIVLLIIFAAFMFNRFKVTQKQKNIIEIKEKETKAQKHLIEEKHKEITDSINYAERIQRSFLASKELLDTNLLPLHASVQADPDNYFVFFKPKDVVSGDFYWASTIVSSSGDENFILCTADSTGHGVPGAIMSLLNITSLEKAIEHYTDPAAILNHTRQIIINRLKKDGTADGGKDGMDCSLIIFDLHNKRLEIAAAHNPVWIVRPNSPFEGGVRRTGDVELIEIKADKMPVGKHDRDTVAFTNHIIDLQPGDVIYTLTDGFPDQFGGEKAKKFMSKNLKELLLSNVHLPLSEQKELLERVFNQWKGDLEQVDDVTVIGIRV